MPVAGIGLGLEELGLVENRAWFNAQAGRWYSPLTFTPDDMRMLQI